MPRLTKRTPSADDTRDGTGEAAPARAPEPGIVAPTPAAAASLGSLSDLPVAGLTRRRMAIVLAALVAAWVMILFARQVGEASAAATRADAMRASNQQLAANVTALEQELTLIQRQAYIEQQAREYRLGEPREIPFVLQPDAPALADDAPGTAAARLGAGVEPPTPLEAWISLLFGPPGDPSSRMTQAAPSEPPTPAPNG